jgi:putative membrane protein
MSTMLVVRAAGALLVLSSLAFAQQPQDQQTSRLSEQDAKILHEIRRAHLKAMAAGKVALDRARVEAVRKYAQLIVDTHSKLLEESDKLAKFKRLEVPAALDGEDEPVSKSLRDTPDDRFDRVFLTLALEAQGRALELASRAATAARDPNLKALATKTAAHLEKQLEIGRELAHSLGAPPARAP